MVLRKLQHLHSTIESERNQCSGRETSAIFLAKLLVAVLVGILAYRLVIQTNRTYSDVETHNYPPTDSQMDILYCLYGPRLRERKGITYNAVFDPARVANLSDSDLNLFAQFAMNGRQNITSEDFQRLIDLSKESGFDKVEEAWNDMTVPLSAFIVEKSWNFHIRRRPTDNFGSGTVKHAFVFNETMEAVPTVCHKELGFDFGTPYEECANKGTTHSFIQFALQTKADFTEKIEPEQVSGSVTKFSVGSYTHLREGSTFTFRSKVELSLSAIDSFSGLAIVTFLSLISSAATVVGTRMTIIRRILILIKLLLYLLAIILTGYILQFDISVYLANWFVTTHDVRSRGEREMLPRIGWSFGTCNTAGMFNVTKLVSLNVSYQVFHYAAIAATGRYAYAGCSQKRANLGRVFWKTFQVRKQEGGFPFGKPPNVVQLKKLSQQYTALAVDLNRLVKMEGSASNNSQEMTPWDVYQSLLIDKCRFVIGCKVGKEYIKDCCKYFEYTIDHKKGKLKLVMTKSFEQTQSNDGRDMGLKVIIDKKVTYGNSADSDFRMPYSGPSYFNDYRKARKAKNWKWGFQFKPFLEVEALTPDVSDLEKVQLPNRINGQEMTLQLEQTEVTRLSNCSNGTMCHIQDFKVSLAYAEVYERLCGCVLCNPSYRDVHRYRALEKPVSCCSALSMVSCIVRHDHYDTYKLSERKTIQKCRTNRVGNMLAQQTLPLTKFPVEPLMMRCLGYFLTTLDKSDNFEREATCRDPKPCMRTFSTCVSTVRKQATPEFENYFVLSIILGKEINTYSETVHFKAWEFTSIFLGVLGMLTGLSLWKLIEAVIGAVRSYRRIRHFGSTLKREFTYLIEWSSSSEEPSMDRVIEMESAGCNGENSETRNNIQEAKYLPDVEDTRNIAVSKADAASIYKKETDKENDIGGSDSLTKTSWVTYLLGFCSSILGAYIFGAIAYESLTSPTLTRTTYWAEESHLPSLAFCVSPEEIKNLDEFLNLISFKNQSYDSVNTIFQISLRLSNRLCRITSDWALTQREPQPVDYMLKWDPSKVKTALTIKVYLGDYNGLNDEILETDGYDWNIGNGLNIEYTVTKKIMHPSVFTPPCQYREDAYHACQLCKADKKNLLLDQDKACCHKQGLKIFQRGKNLCLQYFFMSIYHGGDYGAQSKNVVWKGRLALRKEHHLVKKIETTSRQSLFILIILLAGVVATIFGQNWLDLAIAFYFLLKGVRKSQKVSDSVLNETPSDQIPAQLEVT